ncbi:WD40 repeat domain-containing protein [Endozoicomonas sp. GU-1]|uniref:WD40 repeat domain-containing protein n=1 Tax=Endozoicomonas sp. GU-1 TaxID=3009078 RepID=UPI0022B2AE95|nr:WD40 repeat domain-containing protein [Endozoicomonas sp. GU-1]WBA81310.1 WD40 repeat domain-containing protein [Endozoicomonas sp. GU-1]WBA84257.1 WD40 repeat domain-containing protein [Endozoicomonas sp. GU-1]
MEPPITVNTSGNYGDNPDCTGVTPEVSRYVWNSNGMSVVPCQDQCSLLHLPEPPLLRLLGYLSFREILATAKTCTYLNQVITDEHLLARSWFAKLATHQQNQFKEITRDISDRELQHWLRQFTPDTTLAGKLCSQYLAEQTTDDGRKIGETQKKKYFPQVLFYTVSKLMADCRQFKPVLAKEILDTPGYAISLSTHGDHLVILSNHHTGTIFGYTANSPWHKQASFSFDYWLTADLPISNFETHGRHVLACDKHTATILAYNADNSCTEQLTIFHEGRISSADLSCDGHQAVIICDDGSARIHSWNDAGHWTLAADITDVRRRLKARFSPDGSRVLTHSNSCTKIHRRNEEGGWTLEATSDFYAESVTFSPDGSHVLMYSCYRGIIAKIAKILSLNKDGGWLESAPLTHNEGSVIRVIASPDGRHVITTNQKDGETDSITMKILSRDSNSDWTEKTGNIPIIIHNGAQYWPKFSPDSRHVMVSKNTSNLEIRSCDKRGNWIPTSIPCLEERKRGFFSPDSRHAAIIGAGYRTTIIYSYDEARVWTESGIIPHYLDGPYTDASFSSDSSHIVTFCWYPVTLWNDNIRSKFKVKIYGYNGYGKWLPKAFIRHAGPIYSARFNADGTHLVTASEDRTAVIFGRCADGSWVNKAILRHTRRVKFAFFSVDSRQVVTVSGSHNVKIWRLVAAGMVLDNPPGTPQAATGQGVVLHAGNQKPEANRQN